MQTICQTELDFAASKMGAVIGVYWNSQGGTGKVTSQVSQHDVTVVLQQCISAAVEYRAVSCGGTGSSGRSP
jgi:hypothetical protein